MKIQAAGRLKHTYDRSVSVRFHVDSTTLFSHLEGWTPRRELSKYDTYPTIGRILIKGIYGSALEFSLTDYNGKVAEGAFYVDVDTSNRVFRGNLELRLQLIRVMKQFVKEFKAKPGFKATLEIPERETSAPKVSVRFPMLVQQNGEKPATQPPQSGVKYAVKVVGPHKTAIFDWNPKTGSKGPWSDVGEAQEALHDLHNHLEYDDDFKRASFTLVKI